MKAASYIHILFSFTSPVISMYKVLGTLTVSPRLRGGVPISDWSLGWVSAMPFVLK